MKSFIKQQLVTAGAIMLALTVPAGAQAAADNVAKEKATVTVDFKQSRGDFLHPERYNNFSRWTSWTAQRDADIRFLNEQGLHGEIYKVWVDAERIHDPKTDTYNYTGLDDYLSDASLLSDELLMVMDTRVSVRDMGRSPADIKPIIKRIMTDLKKRYPRIRYVEAFNEPDHNLAKNVTPAGLYDYYKVYYEAVNEINRELQPQVPLELGGPGYMQYNETWMYAFLDRYAADKSPDKKLDFLSWHAYGEFPEGTGDSKGPRAFHFYKGDPSEIAGQRELLNAALSSRGLDTDIPAFITETGIYPGPSFDNPTDPRPDYTIGAAGVPSLHYWYMEQPNTYPFNWVVRHNTEERKDQLITRVLDGERIEVKGADKVEGLPTNIFTPYGNALKMMSMLKQERVVAQSDALKKGKGIYSIATKDEYGAAVMIWNYQHINNQVFDVTVDMDSLPENLRGKEVRQRMYRIDAKTSNYWADPETANLQLVSESVVQPGKSYKVPVDLSPNALQLIVLEPVK
ncbi:GH39 family glycosyl hydrolase [Pseudomaricurvus sp.]|uniref:GH39 family glycosyl hydrolase n=1 Tax=Pseudomaricurvus sp. TaxID=2004510 RepID=UPI003F6B8429